MHGTLYSFPFTKNEFSCKSQEKMRWNDDRKCFFKLSFLKLLGRMNEIVSQNPHDFFINFIANEDCRPNGGFPINTKGVSSVIFK